MPKIERIFTLEVTPEQFLQACSYNELMEIHLLLNGYLIRAQNAEIMTNALRDFGNAEIIDVRKLRESSDEEQE